MNQTPDSDLTDLYRELILDHARSPRNFGRIESATHSAEGINPLCGDKLRLYLNVDATKRVVETSFEGTGCAISIASASLLTETIANLSLPDADAVFEIVTGRLTNREANTDETKQFKLEKLKALDGVREFPSRVKCATLAWHALHAALHDTASTATTE